MIYFISDLHLINSTNSETKLFLHFMQNCILHNIEALYILGDFFEYWVGDDAINNFQKNIAKLLRNLSKNTPIYLIVGNRDFLISDKFAQIANIKILNDPYCLKLDQKRIILSHGDLLCTDDKLYQSYRKICHKKWVQSLFLILPISLRYRFANWLRYRSSKTQTYKPQCNEINSSALKKWLIKYQANTIIHGHTHIAKNVQHMINDITCQRYVLGAWYNTAKILRYKNQSFHFITLQNN